MMMITQKKKIKPKTSKNEKLSIGIKYYYKQNNVRVGY